MKAILPKCGLYKTAKPLPELEGKVSPGSLVYFHNHSDSGLPVVLLPDHNIQNRWHFHGPELPFRSLSWADTLVQLPPEGFYTLRKAFEFDGGSWPRSTLVQLGYTQSGDPIFFIAQLRAQTEENDLFFSDRGVGVSLDKLSLLEPAHVYVEPLPEGAHSSGVH